MFFLHCGIALYNFNQKKKKKKNTHCGLLLLVKFQSVKVKLLHGGFPSFLGCSNGTKLRKTSHMINSKNIVNSFEAQNLLKTLVVVMLLNFSNSGQNIFSRPPENIRKPEVFDVLWEYKKEALA